MAVRRNDDGLPPDANESDPLFQNPVFQGGGPRIDEFGNVVPDFSNDPNYPVPFQDYQPPEIAGNTDTARDLAPQRQANTGPARFALPQGVSVNDATNTGYDEPHQQSAPSMPKEPRLTAMQPQPVIQAQGPQRRSAVNPSIFAQQRNPNLFGRAGGLLEGGQGLTGASEHSGAIAPTEMMRKLLQMFMSQ